MNRKQCLALVERINDLNAIRAMVADVAKGNQKRGTWSYFAQKLLKWIDGGMTGKPPFSVIVANGNKKLPFFAFPLWPLRTARAKVLAKAIATV
jgi:hypothetical protein